jgi:hypothetical protein
LRQNGFFRLLSAGTIARRTKKKQWITLVMCNAKTHVMHQLKRGVQVDLIGKKHFFAFTKYVTVAYEKKT